MNTGSNSHTKIQFTQGRMHTRIQSLLRVECTHKHKVAAGSNTHTNTQFTQGRIHTNTKKFTIGRIHTNTQYTKGRMHTNTKKVYIGSNTHTNNKTQD